MAEIANTPEETITCTKCHVAKPTSQYYTRTRWRSMLQAYITSPWTWCKECEIKIKTKRRIMDKIKEAARECLKKQRVFVYRTVMIGDTKPVNKALYTRDAMVEMFMGGAQHGKQSKWTIVKGQNFDDILKEGNEYLVYGCIDSFTRCVAHVTYQKGNFVYKYDNRFVCNVEAIMPIPELPKK